MASPNTSADATSSSVTLASLPPELHRLIARMCRDQDRRYKARTTSRDSERHLKVAKAGATDWDGRSLNALLLVSKGWSKVAATYIFETVSSGSCINPLFDFEVVPQYASLIRHASFDDDDVEATSQAALLRTLPFFPHLRHLTLTSSTFVDLLGFGLGTTPSPQHLEHRKALIRSTRSIEELSLDSVDADDLAWVLEPLADSALCRLDIVLYFEAGTSTAEARNSLARLKGLRSLSLRDLHTTSDGLLSNPSSFNSELESLELGFFEHHLDLETWTFVETFSRTLTSLSVKLDLTGVDGALDVSAEGGERAPSTPFPGLRHLRVEGTGAAIITVLKLCSASSVLNLDLRIFEYGTTAERNPLADITSLALKLWPASLKRLEVSMVPDERGPQWFRSEAIRTASKRISRAAPGIDFVAQPRSDAFYHYHRFARKNNNPLHRAHQAVTETLNFGLGFSDRLLATGDADGAKALLDMLVPLRGKMLRDRD